MSGHDKAQSTTPPTPLNEQLDNALNTIWNEAERYFRMKYGQGDGKPARNDEGFKKDLKALIESEKQAYAEQADKELLECFYAVAQYAVNPEALGGMKPETALFNYHNHLKQLRTKAERHQS